MGQYTNLCSYVATTRVTQRGNCNYNIWFKVNTCTYIAISKSACIRYVTDWITRSGAWACPWGTGSFEGAKLEVPVLSVGTEVEASTLVECIDKAAMTAWTIVRMSSIIKGRVVRLGGQLVALGNWGRIAGDKYLEENVKPESCGVEEDRGGWARALLLVLLGGGWEVDGSLGGLQWQLCCLPQSYGLLL